MKHKILLVDDHQLILDGLDSIFSQDPDLEVVGLLNNGSEALKYLENITVDLVLTDVNMPVMDGIDLTKKIREKGIAVKVVVLTMHNEKSTIMQIMDIGADGYLLKTTGQDEMIAAVKSVLAGKKYFSSEVTLSLLSNEKDEPSSNFDLSDRETEILKLIAEGFSNKEIGDQLFISHRTVDTHRTNMMKKLEINNIAGLVRFAIKNNIVD